jgi:hypothetical protein
MTDKRIIQIIHDVLQCRDKWYLDHSITEDNPELQEIAEKGKEFADQRLSELSSFALYQRYKVWQKSDPIIGDDNKYFHVFLSDVAFNLGMKALAKDEKQLFNESVSLQFNLL